MLELQTKTKMESQPGTRRWARFGAFLTAAGGSARPAWDSGHPTTQRPPQGCPAAEQGAAWGLGRPELTQLNGNRPSTKTNSLGAPSPRRAQGTWCPHSQIDRP